MTDAFGAITWWGFSPSLDLQDKDACGALQHLNIRDQQQISDELNVLMIGAGDCRHILKTIAYSHRHPKRKINFYVLENNLELYARDLLLLTLALESQSRMGLQEKTEIFLELFGNTLVRQQSAEYVQKMATEFIEMVTNFDYLEKKMPLIDMSLLKFKERDMLEGIFKFWRNPDQQVFDVKTCWNLRVRQHLGPRYDAIPNVFDWDFSMKLSEKGANIIHNVLYSKWRTSGVAYEIREGNYDTPNKTLASGMVFKREGERIARRGYWGDILVSPYIAFGIECEEQNFFKKSNNAYTKTSQDVSEYNILSMFYELVHHEKYVAPKPETQDKKQTQPQTATLTEITEEEEEEEEEEAKHKKENEEETEKDDIASEKAPLDREYESIAVPNAKVFFLPLTCAPDLHKKSRFQRLFDVVYISNSLVHLLTPDLSATFSDKASVILETAKFMIELKNEQTEEFVKKVTAIAQNVGCKVAAPCDHAQDAFARFRFSRETS